jgi:predicted unusual protein kinase regulating ubiquinone biosynthesis (AarF/ABC1/UbiB family)
MRFIILLILFTVIGCGTHPVSQTPAEQTNVIRQFIAASLAPEPGPEKPAIPFKEACFKHTEALYFIINTPELVKASGIPQEIIDAIPKNLDALKDQPLERIAKELLAQPDSFFRENQTKIEEAVKSFKFTLDQLQAIKVLKVGTSWTTFFQNILNNYFSDLNLEDKKRILAFMIKNLKAENTDTQNLLNWVYASGPYFHKYLQLMADYLEPGNDAQLKELKEGLQNVKNGLPSIHPYYIERYLKELRELPQNAIDLEIERKPNGDFVSLGAASVGEAFLATNKATGKQMVVKFKRPGIDEIAKREREFFLNQATKGALRESFEEIARQIDEELDYTKEVEKINLGIPAYESRPYLIHVVRAVSDADFPNGPDYFAMEFVDGVTLEQLGKDPLNKRNLMVQSVARERVARKFMWQAISAQENTFFHGDLHGGNIMVKFGPKSNLGDNPTKEQVENEVNEGHIEIVLIDFGNAHELNQKQRRSLETLFMSSAKISNSAAEFLKAVYPERNDLDAVRIKLEQTVFSKQNRENGPPKKIGDSMDILLGSDLAIPGYIMAFKRSLVMLMNIQDKFQVTGKNDIHKIGEETYTDNLPNLLEGMSPTMRSSLLNGIVLESQAAELEGEKIAGWLEGQDESVNLKTQCPVPNCSLRESRKIKIKNEWIRLRTSWSKESDPTKKSKLFYEHLSFLFPHMLQKLERKDSGTGSKPDNNDDKSSEIWNYWLPLVASGFFSEWETKQISFINDVPMDDALIKNWEQNRKAFAEADTIGKIWYGAKLPTYVPFSVYKQLLSTISVGEKARFTWQLAKRLPGLVADGIRGLPAKFQTALTSLWWP